MAVKQFGKEWTKRNTLKSILLFLVHCLIYLLIAAGLLLGDKLGTIVEFLSAQGRNYLYALFCVILL